VVVVVVAGVDGVYVCVYVRACVSVGVCENR